MLADAGITEACLVIGPEHEVLREYAARDFAGDQRVIVLNSDNHHPREALDALAAAPGSALVGFDREALMASSNIPADRIRAFALVAADAQGLLRDIVEKPDEETLAAYGEDAPVSMNAWLFTPAIFDACERIEPSVRGEREMIDAVRLLAEEGEAFTVVPAACPEPGALGVTD